MYFRTDLSHTPPHPRRSLHTLSLPDSQEVCDLAIKYFSHGPEMMARVIAQEAIKKDSHDNTSAQVIQFPWNGHRIKACIKEKKEKKKKAAEKVVDMFGSDED